MKPNTIGVTGADSSGANSDTFWLKKMKASKIVFSAWTPLRTRLHGTVAGRRMERRGKEAKEREAREGRDLYPENKNEKSALI